VLGGVCAGVANYFGFNPLWLRILFAVLFFGFGTGFLLYVLLWIIIPKAKTTAEKLEMKGENVNIQNIEKSIKEELNDLKKRYADNSSNVKSGINKVFDFIIQMIKFAIKTVVKIAAILMLIVGCALLLALLSFLWNNDFFLSINDKVISGISLDTLLLNFFDTNQSLLLFKSGVLMFVGIPVIAIIFFGFKIIFKLNKPNKIFKISAVILWFVGILVCLISIKGVSKQFSQKFVQKSIVPVLAQNDTLYIDATINENFEDDFLSDEDEENEEEELMEEQLLSWSGWMLSKNDDNYFYAFPYLDIEKSKSDSVELILQKSARGFSAINAESNAKQINYTISQSDSSIVLSSLFNVDKKQKWRNQRLKITLKVPVGKTIYLSGNLLHILRNAENVSSLSNKKMLEHKWMMTENGLVCVDCKSF
jgi:phage shock protein PspC (stress-responsive transcriptional regulator)